MVEREVKKAKKKVTDLNVNFVSFYYWKRQLTTLKLQNKILFGLIKCPVRK